MSAIVIFENDGTVSYTVGATASSGPFPIDFPYFFANEITVWKIVGIVAVEVSPADYTLSGVVADDGFSAGTLVLAVPVSNCVIRIDRTLRTTKATNFPETGAISIPGMNTLFSRLFSWVQDLNRKVGQVVINGISPITSIVAGTGLDGGGTTGQVTLQVEPQIIAGAALAAAGLRLYSEQVAVGGEADLRVAIPANAKRIELEFVAFKSTLANVGWGMTLMQAAGIVETAIYSYQTLEGNAGLTGASDEPVAGTFWAPGTGTAIKGTVRLVILKTPALLNKVYGEGTFVLQEAGSDKSRIHAVSLVAHTPGVAVSGFRVSNVDATVLGAGSFLRCYVVV